MSSLHPSRDASTRNRRVALGAALVSLLASLGFLLAPVERSEVVYSWPGEAGDGTAVAIPLMLARPVELTASGSCADVREREAGDVVVSTTPLESVPGEAPLPGLTVERGEDGLIVRTGGTELPEQDLPAGDCTWEFRSDDSSTTVTVDGEVVETRSDDLRPVVAGVFPGSNPAAELDVAVTADTVFQTSPTLLKWFFGTVAVLALLATLVLLARGERGPPDAVREPAASRRRNPLRWLVDAAVVGLLAVWTVIGPLTVDDGYIAGIIHSRDANGYIGNVHRWFNAPEAPFGWFYEVMDGWSHISSATTWMRTPSSLLGILTWFLLSRGLLPRLGAAATGPWGATLAALVFAAWWLPTNLGLRPEPWVAAGLAAVLVLVERGLRRERLLPLALGLVVAGSTLGVTPTGAVAFLPYLAAAVPILRLARRTIGLPMATLLAAAAAASALLLMFADQSLGAVLRANEIRTALPGAVTWDTEVDRWATLLTAGDVQGPVARRVPVLLTLAAVVALVWHRVAGRWRDGATGALADRLSATFGLSLLLLLFTPTKWTLHFGALAPLGTALIVLACGLFLRRDGHAGGSDPDEPAGAAERSSASRPTGDRVPVGALARATVALTTLFLLSAWAYAGWNQWAYVSDRGIPWRDIPPELFGIRFSDVFLAAAAVTAVIGTCLVVWARVREVPHVRVPGSRRLPTPTGVVAGLAALTVLFQLGSFAKSSYGLRDTYSLAADAAATVSGQPCGLAEKLRVETDPTAGLLAPAAVEDVEDPVLDGFVAVEGDRTPLVGQALDIAGTPLPGWAAEGHAASDGDGPATLVTGWYELPDGFAGGDLPLVVSTSGSRGTGTSLRAEFGSVSGSEVTSEGTRGLEGPGSGVGARDARLDPAAAPVGAEVVRLVARDRGNETALPIAVSAPRVPVTTPFTEVVGSDVPAIVDWPIGFVFPCQRQAVQADGITDVPAWRIASFDDAGDIVTDLAVGGPYAAARPLVDQVQIPVYQQARPMERPIRLFRWEPRLELAEPRVTVEERTVSGLAR